MDKRLISKMIINCFKQYYGTESMPIAEKELDKLIKRIFQTKEAEPSADLYEVVNDTVYEFLTG